MSDTADRINFEALHAAIMIHLKAYVMDSKLDHKVDPLYEDLERNILPVGSVMISRLCNQDPDVVKQFSALVDHRGTILVYEAINAGFLLAIKLAALVSAAPLSPNELAIGVIVHNLHRRLTEAAKLAQSTMTFVVSEDE